MAGFIGIDNEIVIAIALGFDAKGLVSCALQIKYSAERESAVTTITEEIRIFIAGVFKDFSGNEL